jgi:hypothetical protein
MINYDTKICTKLHEVHSVMDRKKYLFPWILFWKKTYGYRLHHTVLSTHHNSILDINWLILTQCQQPLFFCIILLELAADFEKSWGDGHITNTTASKLKVFIMLCKSVCPIKMNKNNQVLSWWILSSGMLHCVVRSTPLLTPLHSVTSHKTRILDINAVETSNLANS